MYNQDGTAESGRKTYATVPESALIETRGDKITGDRYYSKDFAEREWQHMWTKVWHVGGRAAQLPEAGDFIMHNMVFESVIMVRQQDG